ncbi:kinase-like domain-containing protein [Rhizophagus clarus]|uniref:Kinase-like domain-containing protein n=1 Tax=Rhizophagus clarus TaxID=94130 RepID=A0A8H3M5W8_9GLOM|nr:kinase-like domain-containing protein [Rhizophagus clarus]
MLPQDDSDHWQLKIDKHDDIIFEWIPYNQFVDVKEIGKDNYSNDTMYSALWNEGLLRYNSDKREWIRNPNIEVTLKCLNGSQNIIYEVLDEAENYNLTYGISQNPDTEDYIVVLENKYCEKCCEKYFAKIYNKWCISCYVKNSFANWTSGNEIIDDFIQKMLLNCDENYDNVCEWIPYSQLIDIKEIGKVENNVATIYSALWNDGPFYYNYDKMEWIRDSSKKVTLKYLSNQQKLIDELFCEKYYGIIYGISKNPDMEDYIIVLQKYCEKCCEEYTDISYEWSTSFKNIIEWIPYAQFISIKEIVENHDNFITIYSAIWNSSPYYNDSKNKLIRKSQQVILITLNYLDKSSIIDKLLDKIKDLMMDKMEKVYNNSFTIYSAIWKGGPLVHNNKNIYKREYYKKVTLKCLNNSQNKINEFINKVEYDSIKNNYICGISQNPDTKNYIIVFQDIYCEKCEMSNIEDNNTTIYIAVCKKNYYKKVVLKCLNNSENRIDEFFNEAENYLIENDIYGITQNPDTKDYILILNDDKYCKICSEQYLGNKWCKSCQIDFFKDDFKNWTSGNNKIDDSIQTMQLEILYYEDSIAEWIPFNQFINIKEMSKVEDNNTTIYSAIWKDGQLKYNDDKDIYQRDNYKEITLKCLNNSQNKINEFLNKAENYSIENNYIYGISQNPDTKDYIMIYQRNNYKEVALKCLNNSQNISNEFLNEIEIYSINKRNKIMQIYGISQNPDTKNYTMILQYAECGNFNNWMDYYRNFSLPAKSFILLEISVGLKEIHQKQLVHRDFHIGNILINSDNYYGSDYYNVIPISTYISDMGLCGEVNNTDKTNIYGVMPYVAPEVLRKKPYTKAADIYSFGMIMYFIITGRQPFENRAHDFNLALDICNGIRPEIPEIPELKSNWYIDLMKKCWDSNPDNRPDIESIGTILSKRVYYDEEYIVAERYLNKGYKENSQLTTHPQAIYTSRLLNPYTEGLPIDFLDSKTSTTLTKEMESLSVEKKRKASLSAEI